MGIDGNSDADGWDHAFDVLKGMPEHEEAMFVSLLGDPYATHGTPCCDHCGCRYCQWPCPTVSPL